MVSLKYIAGLLSVGLMATATAVNIDTLEKKQLGSCNVLGCVGALATTGVTSLLGCSVIGILSISNPTALISCLIATGLTAAELPPTCGGCLQLPV